MIPAPAVSIDELLSACTPANRALVEGARALIRSLVPSAFEAVRSSNGTIGYSAPAYFAFIVPEPEALRIGFKWGGLLADRHGVLEGIGSQERCVTIRTVRDLAAPGLADLLRAAAAFRQ